jgi:hypothetical protein
MMGRNGQPCRFMPALVRGAWLVRNEDGFHVGPFHSEGAALRFAFACSEALEAMEEIQRFADNEQPAK